MKHPTQPADQRRTHDLGFSDEGPGDVATLIRILGEREAEIVRLRAALEAIIITGLNEHRTYPSRIRSILTTAELALKPKED